MVFLFFVKAGGIIAGGAGLKLEIVSNMVGGIFILNEFKFLGPDKSYSKLLK